MKRLGFSFVVGLCCVLLFSSASWAVTPAPKEVPKFLNFQGLLTDSSGARVTGTQNVTFKIYDVASGGSALYSENHATLSLDNGIASVVIGSVTALTLNFDTHYWIGVTVSPDAEMTPRIPVLTVGYAMTAQNLAESAAAYGSLLVTDTVTATAFVGDGSQLTGITAGSDTDWTIAATTLSVLSKNVGIGIDTPGYALQVKGAAHVSDSFRIGTDSFIVTPGGLVGIGTATPSTTLGGPTVHLNGSAPELRLGNNSWVASGNTISLYNYNTALTTLFVNPQGKFGIGTTTPGDSLHVVGTGRFATQGDSIYITDSGIGIGEINPNVVNGTFSQILHIKSASNPGIVLENTGGGKTYLHTHADGSFSIMNDNNGDEPFHILNDGNVGINTIVPADTFEVVGTVHFSDTLVVDSTITAAIFYGSGAGLTGVAASSLSPANLTTAITADSIATGAVTTSEILDATIGSLDMATDAILSSAIMDGTIENVDVSATAAISGTKIAPSFGAQSILTTGAMSIAAPTFFVTPTNGGRVGVGNAGPEYPFQVGVDSLVVTGAARVGIGIETPLLKLHVRDNQNITTGMNIENTTVGISAAVELKLSNDANDAIFVLNSSSASTNPRDLEIKNADVAGDIRFTFNGSENVIFAQDGRVGIGTMTPTSELEVFGSITSDTVDADAITASDLTTDSVFAMTTNSIVAVTGVQSDFNFGNASFARITGPTGAFTITGIAAGGDGQLLVLHNTTVNSMTLNNEDVASLAANRILTGTGGAISTTGTGTITLIYDDIGLRWIVTAVNN